ncbi:hypothetical protein ACIP93_04530 [Streptomyces sp. NPDC088745]|uniref:hypothetical protein n=1 Tax=Streptomyces sp. NPDC088745 TaxID=3365884 RepID=UPI0038037E5C
MSLSEKERCGLRAFSDFVHDTSVDESVRHEPSIDYGVLDERGYLGAGAGGGRDVGRGRRGFRRGWCL